MSHRTSISAGPCWLLLLIALYTPRAAGAQAVIRTPDLDLQEGRAFVLPIEVGTPPGDGVASFQFTLRYDADLVEISGVETDGTLAAGMAPVVNTATPGKVTVAAAGATPFSSGGTLLLLVGRAKGAGLVGEAVTTPDFEDFLLFTAGGAPVPTRLEPGSLSVAGLRVSLPTPAHAPGEAATLPVMIDDVTGRGIIAYQFTLRYDPSVLRIDGLGDPGLSEGAPLVNTTTNGRIVVAYAGTRPLTGSGALLTLQGRWLTAGDARFTFEGLKLFDTTGEEVPVTPPEFLVTPPDVGSSTGASLLPVRTGDLTGRGVTAYQFRLTYDPAVLVVEGVEVDGTLSAGQVPVVNTGAPGVVSVALGAATPLEGSGTLVNLRARRLRSGDPRLTFTSYRLFATDQRGVPLTISPNKGGDVGSVTATITGLAFSEGTTVQLVQGGTVIEGESIAGSEDRVMATFNLASQPRGFYDLVVTSDGITGNLPDAFEVTEGRAADIWVDVIGRDAIRAGRPQTFTILYGNRGNIDEWLIPIVVAFPVGTQYELGIKLQDPPDLGGEALLSVDQITDTLHVGGMVALPLIFARIPASGTGSFEITLTGTEDIALKAWAGRSLVKAALDGPGARKRNDLAGFNLGECALAAIDLAGVVIDLLIDESCKEAFALGVTNFLAGATHLIFDAARDEENRELAFGAGATMNQFINFFATAAECGLRSLPPSRIYTFFKRMQQLTSGIDNVLTGRDIINNAQSCAPATVTERVVEIVASFDPNEKVGSTGAGDLNYLSGEEPLRYAIYFENLPAATAAAQEVFVTDTLDVASLDLSTFSFGPISWGREGRVEPPPGLTRYATQVDLRPSQNLLLGIDATLNPSNGVVQWTFRSLDPATGLLTDDPFAGFLPPNVNAPEGEGRVLFTVAPRSTLRTGTAISNKARIVFDVNDPIDTNTWINTLDNTPPSSQVTALEATRGDSVLVRWEGSDEGAGVLNYTVYASVDGAPFEAWQTNTAATSAYLAARVGSMVALYSVARDGAGNVERAPAEADATTVVTVGSEADPGAGVPHRFYLEPSYPNPFNPSTVIRYGLPHTAHVRLDVYDVLGRLVARLVDGVQAAGHYNHTWTPQGIASGLYFYRLQTNDYAETHPLVFQK